MSTTAAQAYGSNPFSYDLKRALGAEAWRATPEQIGRSFASACGRQAGAYASAFWANRRRSERAAVQLVPATRDQLVRHAEEFRPEGVEELAAIRRIDCAEKLRRPTAAEALPKSVQIVRGRGRKPRSTMRKKIER